MAISDEDVFRGIQDYKKYNQENFPFKQTNYIKDIDPTQGQGFNANVGANLDRLDPDGNLIETYKKVGTGLTDWVRTFPVPTQPLEVSGNILLKGTYTYAGDTDKLTNYGDVILVSATESDDYTIVINNPVDKDFLPESVLEFQIVFDKETSVNSLDFEFNFIIGGEENKQKRTIAKNTTLKGNKSAAIFIVPSDLTNSSTIEIKPIINGGSKLAYSIIGIYKNGTSSNLLPLPPSCCEWTSDRMQYTITFSTNVSPTQSFLVDVQNCNELCFYSITPLGDPGFEISALSSASDFTSDNTIDPIYRPIIQGGLSIPLVGLAAASNTFASPVTMGHLRITNDGFLKYGADDRQSTYGIYPSAEAAEAHKTTAVFNVDPDGYVVYSGVYRIDPNAV